jgi:lipoprotein NlpD
LEVLRLKFIGYGIVLKRCFDIKDPDLGQKKQTFLLCKESHRCFNSFFRSCYRVLISFNKNTLFLFALALLFLCHEPCIEAAKLKGLCHLVKKSETMKSISVFYHVEIQELMKANNIKNPDLIKAGRVIFIPGVSRFPKEKSVISSSFGLSVNEDRSSEEKYKSDFVDGKGTTASMNLKKNNLYESQKNPKDQTTAIKPLNEEGHIPQTRPGETVISGTTSTKMETTISSKQESDVGTVEEKKAKADQVPFRWPVKGKITRRFGIQPNGMYYNGITIMAKEKIPVLAAAGGKVIFSSLLKDYGETIIVKHEGDYATVYTNLGIRVAMVDDQIKRGDQLGFLGKSEKKGKSFLGFEVRYRNRAVDPLSFLP